MPNFPKIGNFDTYTCNTFKNTFKYDNRINM